MQVRARWAGGTGRLSAAVLRWSSARGWRASPADTSHTPARIGAHRPALTPAASSARTSARRISTKGRIAHGSSPVAGHAHLPTVTYLPYRVSGSTLTAVGRFQLLARWPGTHSRILSGIQRTAQTVLGVYLKRTSSRVTSASSVLGVLNDYALYKSTHSLTHSLSPLPLGGIRARLNARWFLGSTRVDTPNFISVG